MMEKPTYLILRLTEPVAKGYDPLRPYDWRSAETPQAAPAPDYRLETQALDAQDYHQARRDRQVAAIAQPMPLRLIEPVAAAAAPGAGEPAHIHGATWGVYAVGALASPYAGLGVAVAVLDTGIDAGHEAFRGVTLIQKDFTGEGDGDQHGHGTHVAGTIFGQTVGEVRIGVAPGVRRALIGKVLGRRRSATTAELAAAIQWAVDEGAQVINMSLGLDFPGLARWWVQQGMEADLATSKALAQYRDNVRLFDALSAFVAARGAQHSGALLVAAAGNESRRHVRADYTIEVAPPAATDGVVAVAALATAGPPHEQFSVAPFSNIRAGVAAPGVGVYSAQMGGGYTTMSGTSMAAPHVAGVAALWAERQLQREGVVRLDRLDLHVRGQAARQRIPAAHHLDVGEGLVAAPRD
jgi:subtilisin family serine protease